MVPDAAGLAMDGYVRVSRVGLRHGERFISPQVQREQITGWARLHGAHVLEIFEELDESGGRGDRPVLQHALQRIEDGVSDGLIVAKVDRFGRSLLDGLVAIKRIQDVGGRFVSVCDGFDAGTDTGRLVLHNMLSMAEFEFERRRTGWEIAKAKAIERGVWIGAWVPVGYQRTDSGRLVRDPKTAGTVSKLFERRAAGESIPSLRAWLEFKRVRTAKGNLGWSNTTTRGLLMRRVYLGDVYWGPHVHEGAHPALTDPVTWELAQRPRRVQPKRSQRIWLLGGLVRCASCGMTMGMHAEARRPDRHYACRCHSGAGTCPAPAAINASALELRVESVMFDLLGRRRYVNEKELRVTEKRARDAQRSLAEYRDSPEILNALGERAFADGLAARTAALRATRLEVAAVQAKLATHRLPATDQLRRDWLSMSMQRRHQTVAAVVDCVLVRPGRQDYDRRISVCPAGTGPDTLPRQGDKNPTIRSYPHRPEWVTPRDRPLSIRLTQGAERHPRRQAAMAPR